MPDTSVSFHKSAWITVSAIWPMYIHIQLCFQQTEQDCTLLNRKYSSSRCFSTHLINIYVEWHFNANISPALKEENFFSPGSTNDRGSMSRLAQLIIYKSNSARCRSTFLRNFQTAVIMCSRNIATGKGVKTEHIVRWEQRAVYGVKEVGIVTTLRPGRSGFDSRQDKILCSSPKRPDQLRSPTSFLFNK